MKSAKSFASILFALILAGSAAGCGGSPVESTPEGSSSQPSESSMVSTEPEVPSYLNLDSEDVYKRQLFHNDVDAPGEKLAYHFPMAPDVAAYNGDVRPQSQQLLIIGIEPWGIGNIHAQRHPLFRSFRMERRYVGTAQPFNLIRICLLYTSRCV